MDLGHAIWNFLAQVESWDLPLWIREGYILDKFSTYYVLLAMHSLGMAIVVGVCFFISARLFGYGQSFMLSDARRLLPLGWGGFAINLISGLLLFIAQPRRELLTIVYDVKMIMIVGACITMAMLGSALREVTIIARPDGTAVEIVPERAHRLALYVTLFWLMAVAAGRLIGYTQPPPP